MAYRGIGRACFPLACPAYHGDEFDEARMTTTTQAAGVPDGAFAIAPEGRGLVVPQGRCLTVPQGRNAPPIPQGRPSPASSASAAIPTLSLCWIDVTERAADARPRRLPLSDRLHRFIPE
jgi:hypothetical protein